MAPVLVAALGIGRAVMFGGRVPVIAGMRVPMGKGLGTVGVNVGEFKAGDERADNHSDAYQRQRAEPGQRPSIPHAGYHSTPPRTRPSR